MMSTIGDNSHETDLIAQAQSGLSLRYLEGLNDPQRRAVETTEGALLVLAGAGTGKTRVLTSRLAYILAQNKAFPSEILALTFTNRAANEMKERVGDLIGPVSRELRWLGTFHSIGAKILRIHSEFAQLRPDFTILDTDDQLRLGREILRDSHIDESRWSARSFIEHIDRWKNRALRPSQISQAESSYFADGQGKTLYEKYQSRLKSLNAADFGDLLLEVLYIFQNEKSVLDHYRNKFRYILVDEYQDTNIAQYLFLRLLAPPLNNICCVGDDDQSVYSWRGAVVGNILAFEKDFASAKIIRLEQNYRSTHHILACASALISHNRGRLGKTLYTDREGGEKLSLCGYWDGMEEAHAICRDIDHLRHSDVRLGEMCVLVRLSQQMRVFEEYFVRFDIPYRVFGGPRFYERREIRDALAYLKVVYSPHHDLAFERILNLPKRALGDAFLRRLRAFSHMEGISLYAAGEKLLAENSLASKQQKSFASLLACFHRWRTDMNEISPSSLMNEILDESGYRALWKDSSDADAPTRCEALQELASGMDVYGSVGEFLDHVSLVMENAQESGANVVSLMTLHAAKGSEFDVVFLPAWEESLFPHERSFSEYGTEGMEEERRLAHVGITRSRLSCRISFAHNRLLYGQWLTMAPSRFINELAEESVAVHPVEAHIWDRNAFTRAPSSTEPTSFSRLDKHDKDIYEVGMRVIHETFGEGIIASVDRDRLRITFPCGERRVLSSFIRRADKARE